MREGVDESRIALTATPLDALFNVARRDYAFTDTYCSNCLAIRARSCWSPRTGGEFRDPFASICAGLKQLALEHDDIVVVYPVHRNPNVRKVVGEMLSGLANVVLLTRWITFRSCT